MPIYDVLLDHFLRHLPESLFVYLNTAFLGHAFAQQSMTISYPHETVELTDRKGQRLYEAGYYVS